MELEAVVSELAAASARMSVTVAGLGDGELREPSGLPGWSRGHVVAHLARNADSIWNLLEGARCGVEIPQYPDLTVRAAGIEASAGRPAAELAAEVDISVRRLAAQAQTLPPAVWEVHVRGPGGVPHPAWYALCRRWREVEAHHTDLATGHTHHDWSEAYVRWELADTLASLRLDGALAATGRIRATDLDLDLPLGDGPDVTGPARDLLGWLTGRSAGTALDGGGAPLPEPPAWPLRPAHWRTP